MRPVITCVVAVVPALLSTPPAGLDVTVYPVIALPPVLAGGVKLTLAWAFPAVAVAAVGAFGTVAGVTLFDGADGALGPTPFVAVTVNVYVVPLLRPVITCVVAVVPALLSTPPAGLDVTVYPVIALPPLLAGGVKLTLAWAFPAVAVAAVGAFGTVACVTLFDGADGTLGPTPFVAVTVNV